jgi:ABC-2 type transport system ATP-binding protein
LLPILEFDSVSKEYHRLFRPRIRALDSFSLSIEQGEIFGFLGPNGAGKTTAIHLAMGFMRPSHGRGFMLGKPFGDAPTRRRVGFLAENVALCHMPAERLVRFYGGLNGMRDPRLERRTREVLDLVNLLPEAGRNVGKFSRGMQQRIGLAQALVNEPELLILDEPTSALDPAGRATVRELLAEFRLSGRTIFLSSHLLSEIEALCDRVGILHRGRLVRLERTAHLLESQSQSEILARGVESKDFAGSRNHDGLLITVRTPELRPTIERIWSCGGEVVRVNPVRRSLEEIFLELTSDAEPESRELAGEP